MSSVVRGAPPRGYARRRPLESIGPAGIPAAVQPRSGRASLALLDCCAIVAGSVLTLIAAERNGLEAGPGEWTVFFAFLTALVLRRRGLYRFRVRASPLDEPGEIAVCTAISAAAVIVVRSIAQPDLLLAGETLRLWAFVTVAIVALRTGSALLARRTWRDGRAQNTLIVGAGTVGRELAQRLLDRPELGLRPVGFLDKEPLARVSGLDLPVLGASWDLEKQVRHHDVTQVIFAFSTAPHHVHLSLVRRCHELGVGVMLVPRLFEKMAGSIEVAHVGGMALLKVTPVEHEGWQFRVKYLSDRVLAALALLVLSPLMFAIALAVRLTSPGPVIYRQRRVSRDGADFEMLKFRTMYDCPDRSGGRSAWAASILHPETPLSDALVDWRTPLGRHLRRLSLDELPQLVNVLRGEMSLVGPRPETPLLVDGFGRQVYRYGDRHRVKCGMTGWAQVHGLRGDTSLPDRVEWDNYYIENWSPWLDLKILLMTIPCALRGRHAC